MESSPLTRTRAFACSNAASGATRSMRCSTSAPRAHVHSDGREIVFLDKKARARLARNSLEGARAADGKRTYAIIDASGVVITVGHRFRRIPRD
jgi:hypothetical protein